MRRLTVSAPPDRLLPPFPHELLDVVARLDDASGGSELSGSELSGSELTVLLESATTQATGIGATALTFEAEPAATDLDRQVVAAGFELVRTTLQLRRTLPLPGPTAAPVPGVRPFRVGRDEQAWVAVNNRAFAWHPEQSDQTVDDIVRAEGEPWFRADGFLVHDAPDTPDTPDAQGSPRERQIDGFCWTKIHQDHEPPLGEIFVIGVDPHAHGRGLGRALVTAGLDWLAGQGLRIAMLYVEADNEAALGLYRELGFAEHQAHRWWRRTL
jgi:mycothiol synthase